MQPKITEKKQLILFGLSFYGDPFDTHAGWDEDNQIGLLWKRFGVLLSLHPEIQQTCTAGKTAYEIHIYNEETRQKGLFEVFVGMELDVKCIKDLPVEFCVKILPETDYAVFTISGEQINSDWEHILQDWLPTSGFTCPYNYNFQYYDDRFKGVDNLKESALDVYLPVKKAE